MIGKLASRVIQPAIKSGAFTASKRTCYPYYHWRLVTGPVNRVAFTEKLFWGCFIGGVIMSVPCWVLLHVDEYNGKTRVQE
ncbi:hypothetical protein HDE_04043 [Halotydeus destructor]|nr:hypothetical protein HDE_04043 [Halotydeus destructor]